MLSHSTGYSFECESSRQNMRFSSTLTIQPVAVPISKQQTQWEQVTDDMQHINGFGLNLLSPSETCTSSYGTALTLPAA